MSPKVPEAISSEYPLARERAAHETGFLLSTFPEACPFTVDQILQDYWPD